ncbi:MAG: hypothetical protein HYY03_03725 [Chloroflexi bacterium]|nr:hypothetical protein [Chloroflexota bacterium]
MAIDPETGQVIFEQYLAPSDEDLLKSVLATLRVEPIDPATAPWPYSDVATAPIERVNDGKVDYRPPDPGAGLAVTPVYTLSADPDPRDVNFILLRNCRSQLWVGMESGSVLQDTTRIQPVDEAAFQRFLAQVKPRAP